MLSDHDRRTVNDLERRLAIDDAAFVRHFDALAPLRQVPRRHGSGVAQIAGTLVLGILMLLAGSMAGAAAFLGAAAVIGLTWWYVQDPGPEHGGPGDGRAAPASGACPTDGTQA
jgi:hypothetical protein